MQSKRFTVAVLAAAALAVTAAGCGKSTGPGGQTQAPAARQVTVKGSDTMVILGQRWAEVYMKTFPGTRIQVTGGGSGTGIAALQNGTTDIAQSSRPMKDKERKAIHDRYGKDVSEFRVAKDGVSVYVNLANPVKSISMQQLKGIYTGKVRNWKEVGGPDLPITVYSRENNSGTYVFFKEHVLDKEDYTPSAQNLPGTASVVNAISRDKSGIGYGGVAYTKGARDLPVIGKNGGPAYPPTREMILSGKYPLARDLYLYTVGEPSGEAKKFIQWTLSAAGQKVVDEVKYIPIGAAK